MSTRNTIILLLIAAGLFAFVFFYENKQPTTEEAAQLKSIALLFNPESVDGVLLTNNETSMELHKRNGAWFVDAPVQDRADWKAVSNLLATAVTLQKENTLDKIDREYGVTNSNIRLKFLGKGAPPEILFGKESTIDGRVYMRLDGQNNAFVARDDLKKLVTQKVDDFRDHRLTDINLPQVNRIILKTPEGEIGLLKERERWQIDKPIKARADNKKVENLVSRIIGEHIESFVSNSEAGDSTSGLSEPIGTVSVFTEEGGKPSELQIGKTSESGKVYAKLSSRSSVCLLPASFGRVVETRPNDLRDRHLLPLNLDIVDRIHIGQPGKPELTLVRKIENWMLKGSPDVPANNAEVKRLATLVEQQEVDGFVADVASDLQKYGLDQPQLRVTFSSYSSENTAESEAGEHQIGTISFGKIEGQHIYARLEEEPYVVSVSLSMLNSILTDPAQWRALNIFKYKPMEIVLIKLNREGRQPLTFSRDPREGWKLLEGSGALNKIAVESLCNTLASLRAVRWSGSGADNLGFDKPSVVLTFTTANNKSTRLTVGNMAHETMWNAMTDAIPGAFIISRPDMETMQAELVEAGSK